MQAKHAVPSKDWHQEELARLLQSPLVKTRVGFAHTRVGHMFRFDLCQSFPVTTAKKLFFDQVKRELYCFLKGQTSRADLHKAGVKIWDADMDRKGVNDIGPIYGAQWRNWGGEIGILKGSMFDNKGFDQLRWAIDELLRSDLTSRRAIVSAWNAPEVLGPAAVLPPCHILFQFNVVADVFYIDVYQRSADVFLGLPFDVASFAIMAQLVLNEIQKYYPHITFGCVLNYHVSNLHLYAEHVDAAKAELANDPSGECPELICTDTVDTFSYSRCHLLGYKEDRIINAKLLTDEVN